MVAERVPERDFRGPGCTDACEVLKAIVPGRFGRSELLIHDPSSHEEYGRITAGPTNGTVVWTGSLVIDRWARTVASAGRVVRLTEREWSVLDHLARHVGRLCSLAEIVHAVWGSEWVPADHMVRVNMVRVRQKLGDNGRLIETRIGFGYRLIIAPPIECATPLVLVPATRPNGWATLWDRCICCGKTDSPHRSHGRCGRCGKAASRYQHHGPCGAPRVGGDS
jgi:DNA-binding winged helix-turn-helix (wHTH) protein